MLTEELVKSHLYHIKDPYSGIPLILPKTLKSIVIQDNKDVYVVIQLGFPAEKYKIHLHNQIENTLSSLPGIEKIDIKITWKINSHVVQKGTKALVGIKNIIAVASGKGGVGKSTTALNLALAMLAQGAKVGILDADIYGPSQPTMLGIHGKPSLNEKNKMEPILQYGLQSMSMGYLHDNKDAPLVWRGPMVSSAVQQLLFETAWDNLDYLIVDLPPGTGDIQLTLAQKIPVSGVVIVTTPQDIALLDAKKALLMFNKLNVSILGIIENMSFHICKNCGYKEAIFGEMGGNRMAEQYEVPFLGEIPLDNKIREQSDKGIPLLIVDPNGPISKCYLDSATRILMQLSLKERVYQTLFPPIVVQNN